MPSRALHLEGATSLSVEGFLDAFDRFTNRRGLPKEMVLGGGTNFRGTARYIKEVADWFEDKGNTSSLIFHTAHLGVQWTFNPPSSPHFGGGWEVSVRSVKDLLYISFGNHSYSLPELNTIFTKIEGILNSRPLQPISNSPEDAEPLTPAHFLIGQPITALPELDLTDVPLKLVATYPPAHPAFLVSMN
uniref:4-hydroxy-3-methylbut-2-enyl diphosphate reductase n=1 Tax=Lygus hesperus TaxID=30085 RepID=A0A0A9YJ51_LYGHE